jgi:sterol 14-demethylase
MDSFIKIAGVAVAATVLLIIGNAIRQLLPRSKSEPPAVFHWIPIVGNAISYGMDPPTFFRQNREKVRWDLSIDPLARAYSLTGI